MRVLNSRTLKGICPASALSSPSRSLVQVSNEKHLSPAPSTQNTKKKKPHPIHPSLFDRTMPSKSTDPTSPKHSPCSHGLPTCPLASSPCTLLCGKLLVQSHEIIASVVLSADPNPCKYVPDHHNHHDVAQHKHGKQEIQERRFCGEDANATIVHDLRRGLQ